MSSGTSSVSQIALKGNALLQFRYNDMSFYSLMVRDRKRGWVIGISTLDVNIAKATRLSVLKDPDTRCQIIKTDNTVALHPALQYIKRCDGKGLSKVFTFNKLSTA